jgi:hypothetical protein
MERKVFSFKVVKRATVMKGNTLSQTHWSDMPAMYQKYQVLRMVSQKMTAFWEVAWRSVTEADRHFRGAYCPHHHADESEMMLYFCETTWCSILEGCPHSCLHVFSTCCLYMFTYESTSRHERSVSFKVAFLFSNYRSVTIKMSLCFWG